MAKKHNRNSSTSLKRKIMLVLIAAALIAVGGWFARNAYDDMTASAREARIRAIYDSLKMDDSYKLADEEIFGDKRTYVNNQSRTRASQRTYVREAAVDETAADARKTIEAAGFTFTNEPFPNSAYIQYNFKNDKDEYIRLTVSSKVRDDAFRDQTNPQSEDYGIDPNSGPSNVKINVNLDDNNE